MTICHVDRGWRSRRHDRPDDTIAYVEGKPMAPKGALGGALADLADAADGRGREFDTEVMLDGDAIFPHVSWAPIGQVTAIDGRVPDPDSFDS